MLIQAIRRRLTQDEGMSIVEMIVAIFVLTVAIFALLGGLIASARSLADQRSRAAATRVVTSYLEGVRALGYEEVLARLEAGGFDGTPEAVTLDGRTFQVAATAEEVPADPDAPLDEDGEPIGPTVVQVTAQLTWSLHGGGKTVTYSTAIGPRTDPNAGLAEALAGERIVSVNTHPNPSAIRNDPAFPLVYGRPSKPISVVVVLQGFDDEDTTLVTARWTNKNGTTGSITLTTLDQGITWTGTIGTSTVYYPLTVEEAELGADLELEVVAGTHTRFHSLGLVEAASNPPVIESISTAPYTIFTVEQPPGGGNNPNPNCGPQGRCLNTQELLFSLEISAVNPAEDSVRMTYQILDGTTQEQTLVYNPDADRWEVTIQYKTVKLKRGTNQPFNFTVTRSEDGATASGQLVRQVTFG